MTPMMLAGRSVLPAGSPSGAGEAASLHSQHRTSPLHVLLFLPLSAGALRCLHEADVLFCKSRS